METGFQLPDFFNFPPFFTIQPVRVTREKQLQLWRDLILSYHKQMNQPVLFPSESALFQNDKINRKLNEQGIQAVINELIETGYGEWEDDTRTRVRLFWKRPEEWAAEIYDYVNARGMMNTVYTIWELHSGDQTRDAVWYGLEPWLILRALEVLEDEGKAQIIPGPTTEDNGVKFLYVN